MQRARRSGDDGFTILEVMFAAFIMFFVLTALLGLTLTSMQATETSGIEGVATNVANRVIEQARLLSYAQVGTVGAPSGQVIGALPSVETTVHEGVSFTITRTVTWVDDPQDGLGGADTDALGPLDYKRLRVSVSWTSESGSVASMVFATNIRDRGSEEANPPICYFTNLTPTDNAVLFNTNTSGLGQAQVWAGNPLVPDGTLGNAVLQGYADDSADVGGVIQRFEFWVDGKPVTYGTDYAVWTPNTPSFTNEPFFIDTRALDANSEPLMPDGKREFKVQAWDNSGARRFQIRHMIVDNYAPVWSVNASATVSRAESTSANSDLVASRLWLRWNVPMDGTDIPERRDISMQNVNAGATTALFTWSTVGAGGLLAAPSTEHTFAPSPGQLYRFGVVPRSPRGLSGEARWSNWLVAPLRLSGRTVKSGSRANVFVTLSPSIRPTYAHLGCTNNTVWIYRFKGWSGTVAASFPGSTRLVYNSSEPTWTASPLVDRQVDTNVNPDAPTGPLYYVARMRICTDPNHGVYGFPMHQDVWSNAIGPIDSKTEPILVPN